MWCTRHYSFQLITANKQVVGKLSWIGLGYSRHQSSQTVLWYQPIVETTQGIICIYSRKQQAWALSTAQSLVCCCSNRSANNESHYWWRGLKTLLGEIIASCCDFWEGCSPISCLGNFLPLWGSSLRVPLVLGSGFLLLRWQILIWVYPCWDLCLSFLPIFRFPVTGWDHQPRDW